MVSTETHFTGTERDLLYLALESGEIAALYAEDVESLQEALGQSAHALGVLPAHALLPFQRDQDMSAII